MTDAGKPTMIFHTGMTSGYVWDHGKPGERRATYNETVDILEEIEHTLKEDLAHLVYYHKAGMLLCMNSLMPVAGKTAAGLRSA